MKIDRIREEFTVLKSMTKDGQSQPCLVLVDRGSDYAMPWVIWGLTQTGHAFRGDYCNDLDDAHQCFLERASELQ